MDLKQITKDDLTRLVSLNKSGVYLFEDSETKTVWISYASNLINSISRNLGKTNEHTVLKYVDLCFTKYNKYVAVNSISQAYRDRGYKVLSRTFNYYIKGYIGDDYRDASKKLYYVVLATKNYTVRALAVCTNGIRGERLKKQLSNHYDVNTGDYLTKEELDLTTNYNRLLTIKV